MPFLITEHITTFPVKTVLTPSHVWKYCFLHFNVCTYKFHKHQTVAPDCSRCSCIHHVYTNARTKVRYAFGFLHQESLMSLQSDTGTSLIMHAHPYILPFAVE